MGNWVRVTVRVFPRIRICVLEEIRWIGITPSSRLGRVAARVRDSFTRMHSGRFFNMTTGPSSRGGSSGLSMISVMTPRAPFVMSKSVCKLLVTMTFIPIARWMNSGRPLSRFLPFLGRPLPCGCLVPACTNCVTRGDKGCVAPWLCGKVDGRVDGFNWVRVRGGGHV